MKVDTRGAEWTSYRMDNDGNWVQMTDEEVRQAYLRGEKEREEAKKKKGHYCDENPIPYEFWEDGEYYHGMECSICGHLIHTG